MINATLMTMTTLSSTHAGSGSSLSVIDLPIQREVHTGLPKFEASSVKGSIRSALMAARPQDAAWIEKLLGRSQQGSHDDAYASAVAFGDAKLLFFPVRSMKGIFAWATCPFLINRFLQDCGYAGKSLSIQFPLNNTTALVSHDSPLLVKHKNKDQCVILDEYRIDVEVNHAFASFMADIGCLLPESEITKSMLKTHGILLTDDDLLHFATLSTEVVTRIKVDSESGTASETHALFTEEHLPPETILYNLLFYSDLHTTGCDGDTAPMDGARVKAQFEELFNREGVFRLGGDMTLGKGFIKYRIINFRQGGDI